MAQELGSYHLPNWSS